MFRVVPILCVSQTLSMAQRPAPPIRRLQTIGISVVGAVAVVCFVFSLFLDDGVADTFRTVAVVAAIIAALIGVSFAFTGEKS